MEVFNKVKEIIVEELNVDAEKVTLEASLKDDLGADSIDIVFIITLIIGYVLLVLLWQCAVLDCALR